MKTDGKITDLFCSAYDFYTFFNIQYGNMGPSALLLLRYQTDFNTDKDFKRPSFGCKRCSFEA